MKKARKALLTLCAALLLVSMTVGATVAYLTSTTGVVENTFTVGNVAITLDEVVTVAESGNWNGDVVHGQITYTGEQVAAGTVDPLITFADLPRDDANIYKLMPGRTYIKDPTVHVGETSENAWLFVKVDNGIKDIMDADAIDTQMDALGWNLVNENVYTYNRTVVAGEDIPVFKYFKIKNDAVVSSYEDAEITVQAYAVQADGFNTAADALAAAPADWQ